MSRNIHSPTRTDTNRLALRDRRLVLTAALVVVVLVAGGAATTVASADSQVVSVENGTVAPGETVSVNVTLSETPDGVAGYEIVVSVENQTIAGISNSSIPETFGIQSKNSSDSQVTLVASDLNEQVQSGATDVRLGTLTLSGETSGETPIAVQVNQFDADGGNPINATTQAGTLVVETNSSEPDDEPADDEPADDEPADDEPADDEPADTETSGGGGLTQMGIVAGVVVIVLVGYLVSRVSSDDDEDEINAPPPR